MEDLVNYGRLADTILPSADDELVELTTDTLPAPPAELTSAGLVLVGHADGRRYASGKAEYWADDVQLFGQAGDYRDLGLLLLACVLHRARVIVHFAGDDDTRTELDEGRVRITDLVLDYEAPAGVVSDGVLRYEAAPIDSEHPLSSGPGVAHEPWAERMPALLWDTGAAYGLGPARTVTHGFGPPAAAAAFGALLLDFALPGSHRDTPVRLECHAGHQAVALQSTELTLHLGYERY